MRNKRKKGEWRPPGAPDGPPPPYDTRGPYGRPDVPPDIPPDIPERPMALGGPVWLQRVLKPKSPLAILVILMALGIGIMSYTQSDPRRVFRMDPPWQPGEVSRLEARDPHGGLQFTWVLRVDSQGEQTVFTVDRKGAGFHEHSVVYADPHNLIPTRTEFERESVEGRVTYLAEYWQDEVTIRANIPRGYEEAAVNLPARPFYDYEQFMMVIRALPLSDRFRGTLRSVVTRAGAQDNITLRVRSRENVSVPAGEFDAWKIQITGTGQLAWIAVAHPHQLVKYEDQAASTLSELVNYTEGTVGLVDD